MKSYVINLNRSPDRWEFMKKQFNKINQNLPVERVEAVDGMLLSDEAVSEHYDPDLTYDFIVRTSPLSKGEIACFLSHRKCWELVLNGNDEYAAIFEDDIIFSLSVRDFLINNDWIPKKADILKLEKAADYVWVDTQTSLFIMNHYLYEFFSDNICCGAYIISRKAAAILLKITERFSLPVDHLLFDDRFPYFDLFSVWLISPAICIQYSAEECNAKRLLKDKKNVQPQNEWIPECANISISTLEDERKAIKAESCQIGIVPNQKKIENLKKGIKKPSLWKKIRREWIRMKCNSRRKQHNNKKIRILFEE